MQAGNERDSKVVSILDRNESKKKAKETNAEENSNLQAESFTWADVMKRNAENASRLKREREKSNKGVIRSYRLKH